MVLKYIAYRSSRVKKNHTEIMECFVCYDDRPPLYAVCGCTGRYVHTHCLIRTIQSCASHASASCPICKVAYKERVEIITHKRRTSPRLRSDVCVDILGIVGIVDIVFCFFIVRSGREILFTSWTAIILCATLGSSLFMMWVVIRVVYFIDYGKMTCFCTCDEPIMAIRPRIRVRV